MSYKQIPLSSSPGQELVCSLTVDGSTRSFGLTVEYSEVAGYWVMSVKDANTNSSLLSSIPLVPGNYPAGNILRAYSYLKIGSAYLVNLSDNKEPWPSSTTLGSEWILVWGDTPEQ